jgi:hypothetical protein
MVAVNSLNVPQLLHGKATCFGVKLFSTGFQLLGLHEQNRIFEETSFQPFKAKISCWKTSLGFQDRHHKPLGHPS